VDRTAERLVGEGELPWHPSFFEMLTAMAFEFFARRKVEIAVLEVGMGGRLDATNVGEPVVSVITDISLDHQKFLGNTVAEIAREKVGIIRRGGIVVTLPQQPQANDVIGNAILEADAHAVSAAPFVPPVSPGSDGYLAGSSGDDDAKGFTAKRGKDCAKDAKNTGNRESSFCSRYRLQVMGEQIVVETPLVGRHQLRNVALAVAAAEELGRQGFPVTARAIERGIRETRWPGRFQVVAAQSGAPEFVFDVAHNPAGAWALRSTLSSVYGERPLVYVFGAMRDKAISEIAEVLFPLAERVVATRAENPRSASAQEIRAAASRVEIEIEDADDVAQALERAKTALPPRGVVVVTGSIYVVGEAMRALGIGI
jgi:dihydrofolate synthase/folylpolyglutamate synthase